MSNRAQHRASATPSRRRKLLAGVLALSVPVTGAFISLGATAQASAVSSAVFTGGAGTATTAGTVYAKQGGSLTLEVTTTSDTRCISGLPVGFTGARTATSGKTSWTFTTTAPAGNGVQAFTVAASPNVNPQGACTGATNSTQASYVLDNTGPVVSAALTPAPNAAGWNNDQVTVKWTAEDTGAGVAVAQPFQTDTVNANGIVTLTAPAQKDRLGNAGSTGSVTVRVDKAAPTITAAQTKNADGTTTITFTCDDSNSGGAGSGIASCVADGTSPATNSKTVAGGVTVTGTATDKAGNTAKASSTAPAGDSTAPLLSGAPTTSPNGDGWYKDDVVVAWTASDPESGIPAQPANTTITGEGTGLTSTQSVTNGAGLKTTATSPAVKIDRTAPTTGISGASNTWVNGTVTVSLSASDNLSQVASTTYAVDGGAAENGSSFSLSEEGDHTVTYFSTDKAGNAEAPQTAHVKIDKTAPTISHAFAPLSYTDGAWTNHDVTVTFTCADQGGSGVAACTDPVTTSAEGEHTITGTATDGAGTTATDSATVRIDKTDPVISASVDREPNANGWYDKDVTVSYTATDDRSGVVGSLTSDVLGEGANQSAGATVFDAAGNSASAGVTGINVDKTEPVLSASFEDGWHTDDVVVTWSCTDTLSGVATAPADDLVKGEGANLSSTASCTDEAGNTATKTVDGIQIDRTAPTTTPGTSGTPRNGWHSADVDVTLTGADNLSGIAATYYTVDGGAQETYSGAFSVGEGTHTIAFWSKDGAGNVEASKNSLTVKVDKTAPETAVINPISPDSGWFVKSGIPVAFTATDEGSGVEATYYTIDGGETQTYGEPFTAELSEGTHTIAYWSVDLAGNDEAKATTKTVTVKVDTLAPVVTPADVNDNTWRNTPLSQAFTATDGTGSGLADPADASFTLTVTADSTKDATGVVPTVASKTVGDKAGNTTTRTVSALIDTVKPTAVTFVGGPAEGARYYTNNVPSAPTCTATDALSGVKSCVVTGWSAALGSQKLVATATDNAGNVTTAERTYTVKNLDRKGFFAPVDMNGVYNTIKGGNTVPLKFEVFDGTQELRSTSYIQGFSAVKAACDTGAAVDAVELFTTAGQTELRYDTTGDQFIQNWKTPTGSGCYKVTVTTVDGQAISALFKTNK